MRRYKLAPHVHLQIAGDVTVLLDLKRNTYLGVDSARASLLAPLVEGWPVQLQGMSDQAPDIRSDSSKVLTEFLQNHLLAEHSAIGHAATPIVLPTVDRRLGELELGSSRPHRLRHVARFVSAWATSVILLRCSPLNEIVERVQRRKKVCSDISARSDISRIHELTCVFRLLRALVYGAKDRCLFDSLTLTEFLAGYQVFPMWVIGVRAEPSFMAHSWVQVDDYVLNGAPEYVRSFAPILAV